MLKNFGKVLLLSLLVVSLAAPAFATTARVNSLAQTGSYINDDSNIFHWYGVLPSYANLVMAEVGTWYGYYYLSAPQQVDWDLHQALGMTYSCGEDGKYGTWGLFLLRNDVTDNSFLIHSPISYGAFPWYDLGVGSLPVNKLAIMWGKEFEKFSLGLSFTRSDQSYSDEYSYTSTYTIDRSYTTIGAGIRADIRDDVYSDLSATVGMANYDAEGGPLTTSIKMDKGLTLDFAGRMFYEWKDDVTIVPAVEYYQSEYALENQTQPNGSKYKAFYVGGAFNFDVNTNNLLILGAQIDYFHWEYSDPGTDNSAYKLWGLPTFYLALESNVKPWLTARIGAWKSLEQVTNTYNSTATPPAALDVKSTGTDFQWSLGLGFHVAEFDIDAELGPEAPFNVGYWLTGYENWSTSPITRLSATYHF